MIGHARAIVYAGPQQIRNPFGIDVEEGMKVYILIKPIPRHIYKDYRYRPDATKQIAQSPFIDDKKNKPIAATATTTPKREDAHLPEWIWQFEYHASFEEPSIQDVTDAHCYQNPTCDDTDPKKPPLPPQAVGKIYRIGRVQHIYDSDRAPKSILATKEAVGNYVGINRDMVLASFTTALRIYVDFSDSSCFP
jgi:hypothetical protein